MANTDKATEARKLKRRFGEFMHKDENAEDFYNQIIKTLYPDVEFKEGKPVGVDDGLVHFALTQAKAAGIDLRVPGQMYILEKDQKQFVVIGINGLVAIAENTGNYGGTTKPQFEINKDSKLISCTIGIHKVVQGHVIVSEQEVDFKEYSTGEGFWNEQEPKEDEEGGKPKTMIKKVALAHVLRASFSVCAGLYIKEELEKTVIINPDVVPPSVKEDIQKAKTKKQLEEVIETLSTKEQKKLAPVIREKLKELKK